MSTAIATKPATALVAQADLDQILALDNTAREANRMLLAAERDRNDMAKGLIMAKAMKRLQALMTPEILRDVMELQGSKLGFRTDKDSDGGYKDPQIIRDIMIQALLRGLRPTGNEINIIAGSLYVTKEGFQRLLSEFPGLSNLHIDIGVPANAGDGALVPARASWKLDGKPDELICERRGDTDYRIAVRVNKGQGVDAIQGKAASKLFRRVYERLTGTLLEVDADTADAESVEPAKA